MKKISRVRKPRKLADLSVPLMRKKGADVNGGHYDAFLKIETIDSGVKTLRSR